MEQGGSCAGGGAGLLAESWPRSRQELLQRPRPHGRAGDLCLSLVRGVGVFSEHSLSFSCISLIQQLMVLLLRKFPFSLCH